MADFFTTASVVDKAKINVGLIPQSEEEGTSAAPGVSKNTHEPKEASKGSNFSMCEIIM